MSIASTPQFAPLDDLYLDPRNPRLGRSNTGPKVTQEEVLEIMEDWKLDELAVSFLESGEFWVNEAVLAVQEKLYGRPRLVVVEGNRRIAALLQLRKAFDGDPPSRKWKNIVEGVEVPEGLFERVPYLLVDDRSDIEAFLGFRHVTGIEEWRPAEKAEYISRMIDRGMSYEEVMRKIGSKTNTVRQNYIAYNLLLEIDDSTDIPSENFEERFSVMYLSLRTEGVQKYLSIDIKADPSQVKREIPQIHQEALANFALWMFGDEDRDPVFPDSRKVDQFGVVLQSKEAVEYLERSSAPSFDVAHRIAGGDEIELVRMILSAADNIQMVLSRVHHYTDSKEIRDGVQRLSIDVRQLLRLFPELKDVVCEEKEDS